MSKLTYRDIEPVTRQLIFYKIEGERLDEFGLMKARHFDAIFEAIADETISETALAERADVERAVSVFGPIRGLAHCVPQPEPVERGGAGWVVFEQLAEQQIADSTALDRMTQEQRLVFAFNFMRQEVNSGGFDSYFRYSGGNTAGFAAEAARMVSPRWGQLVEDVCRPLGSP